MTEKIKNLLGVAIIVSIIIVAISVWNYSNSYSKSIEPSSFRSFSVSGEGKVTAIPDIAKFTFSVITQGGKNIGDLQKDNTQKVNKVIEFIKSKNVESKDVKTQSYNLEPRYQYYSCHEKGPCLPPEIVGYTITQVVSVKIRDFTKIGDILSGVVQNGANMVSSLSFTIDDQTDIQNKVRTEAITKAKEKAKSIAKAGGFKVGRLLSISEGGQEPVYRYKAMEAMGIGGGEAPSPDIEPGSQEITVNVMLIYEIE